MLKLIRLSCLLSASMLAGCASSDYVVQYDSTPQSAMVVCNGNQMGYTPLNLYYPKNRIYENGYLTTAPCKAVWASGASEDYRQNLPTSSFPDGIKLTVQRPNTDGYSADATADYQKKMNDEQIRQARQQNLQNLNQTLQSMRPKQTFCNQIGTQVICNSY